MVLLIILIIILLIIFLAFFIPNKIAVKNMLWHFRHGNVIVSGHKGKGKDLLFQYVIYKRKDTYYSNINYGYDYKFISLLDVSCAPNTYDNLINNAVVRQKHTIFESKDIYISDGGNFLPSHMDSALHKKYPSMPLYYSLSRHLYDNNVHINTQSMDRIWKPLREQADFYVCCKRTYHLPFHLVVKCISYDKYESCKSGLLPLKKRMLNKQSKNQYDLYLAQNGDIRKFYVFVPKSKILYDTRAFEKILLKGRRKFKRS